MVYSILVPRGPSPIGQHREWSNTGSPPFTDFLSNLANLIGWEYDTSGDEIGPPSVFVFYVCGYVSSVCLVSPNSTDDKEHNGQAFQLYSSAAANRVEKLRMMETKKKKCSSLTPRL